MTLSGWVEFQHPGIYFRSVHEYSTRFVRQTIHGAINSSRPGRKWHMTRFLMRTTLKNNFCLKTCRLFLVTFHARQSSTTIFVAYSINGDVCAAANATPVRKQFFNLLKMVCQCFEWIFIWFIQNFNF